jgi:hypothetical protein
VTAGAALFQTDLLWSRIDAGLPAEFAAAPLQPLTLFDMEDLETALGDVGIGYSLIELLVVGRFGRFDHAPSPLPAGRSPPVLRRS